MNEFVAIGIAMVVAILAVPVGLLIEQITHTSPRHFYERDRAAEKRAQEEMKR